MCSPLKTRAALIHIIIKSDPCGPFLECSTMFLSVFEIVIHCFLASISRLSQLREIRFSDLIRLNLHQALLISSHPLCTLSYQPRPQVFQLTPLQLLPTSLTSILRNCFVAFYT
jgi:hypothetical protein